MLTRTLLNYYGEVVSIASLFCAWLALSFGVGGASLVLGSTKSKDWFSRFMLALACVTIAYAVSIAVLTSARWLVMATTGH